jgi:1-acyl-sn-glycerol-3-phosphate acyltransferase
MEKALYKTGRLALTLLARTTLDMRILYDAPLPQGPKIIAPNHPTTIDPFVITTVVREQVHVLVTESAFKMPLFGAYLRRAGHIPVVARSGREAFDAARNLLLDGKTIAIFTEGALSPTGGYGRSHTGAARLALHTGAPIIPVGIALESARIRHMEAGVTDANGEVEVARLYFGGPYMMTVGLPWYLQGDVENRELVRATSEQLMQRIMALADCSAHQMLNQRTATQLTSTQEFTALN